jgi:hypothetical protein
LIDPNTAAQILPSIAAAGKSLFAGFWVECLFRAVPIAGGMLVVKAMFGSKLGQHPAKLVSVMLPIFIVQSVIFGAAHADYPAQPSYARLVELIFPSVGFGTVLIWVAESLLLEGGCWDL